MKKGKQMNEYIVTKKEASPLTVSMFRCTKVQAELYNTWKKENEVIIVSSLELISEVLKVDDVVTFKRNNTIRTKGGMISLGINLDTRSDLQKYCAESKISYSDLLFSIIDMFMGGKLSGVEKLKNA